MGSKQYLNLLFPASPVVLFQFQYGIHPHSGKSATIRESNRGWCVCKEHYT